MQVQDLKCSQLKLFRVGQNLSQKDMACKIGCSLRSYQVIENRQRKGSVKFWVNFRKAFNLSGNKLMELVEDVEEREANNQD